MSEADKNTKSQTAYSETSSVERFLQGVEQKTTNPVHRRLLKVCRHRAPTQALEEELASVINELLRET